jgi:hypothetical protein
MGCIRAIYLTEGVVPMHFLKNTGKETTMIYVAAIIAIFILQGLWRLQDRHICVETRRCLCWSKLTSQVQVRNEPIAKAKLARLFVPRYVQSHTSLA